MKYFKKIIVVLFGFIIINISQVYSKSIVINEFVASNSSSYYDENYYAPDWIELYNSTDSAINLNNWRIGHKSSFSKGWKIPDTTLAPKSYMIINASQEDRVSSGKYVIEASGWGVQTFFDGDSFRFYYTKLTGDFDIFINVNSLRDCDLFADLGLVMRENLNTNSPFVGLFCQRQDRARYNILYRSDTTKAPISLGASFSYEYPNSWLRLIRTGDSISCYTLLYNYSWTIVGSMYFPTKDTMFVGIAFAPYNFLKFGKAVISTIELNGKPFDFQNFSVAEVGTYFHGRSYESKELHTSFNLSKDGDAIYLWDSKGNLIDNIEFTAQLNDVSYGRYHDGGDLYKFIYPATPEAENMNPYNGKTTAPTFSRASGLYEYGFYVTITDSDPNATIRYTLDSSEPTDSSKVYKGEEILIKFSTILRAKAYSNNNLPSKTTTASYLLNENPKLPLISISTDSIKLWEPMGGFFSPFQMYSGLEVPVHFDYFDENGTFQFQSDAGIKIHGMGSRTNTPEKSIGLYARNKYENSDFIYQFFKENSYNSYSSFLLKAGNQDWSQSFIREPFTLLLSKGLNDNIGKVSINPCLVYFNRNFYGLSFLTEKISETYLSVKYNIDESSVNLIENNVTLMAGSLKPFWDDFYYLQNLDMTDSLSYKQIDTKIDVDELIDYLVMRLFTAIIDWPGTNQKFWNSTQLDNKWHWIIYDSECTLGLTSGPDKYSYSNIDDGSYFGQLVNHLYKNNTFKYKFINRLADLYNTHFKPERTIPLLDSFANIVKPEIKRQQTRWDITTNWDSAVTSIRDFLIQRPDYFRYFTTIRFNLKGLSNVNVKIIPANSSTVQINTLSFDKSTDSLIYFKSVPITISVKPNDGFVFKRWSDPSLPASSSITIYLRDTNVFYPIFETTTKIDTSIVINEIMYNSSYFDDWIELYNASTNKIDLSNWMLKDNDDNHVYYIPQNTFINGFNYLIICKDSLKFKKANPSIFKFIGEFYFNYDSTDQVRLYDNYARLIDSVSYTNTFTSDSIPNGYSIELINPYKDNRDSSNWKRTEFINGTPDAENSVYSSFGINDLLSNSISIFPNPVKSLLYINNTIGSYYISIYNSIGQKMIQQDNVIINNSYKIMINFPDGLYYITLNDGKTSITKSFIVKN